MNTTTNLFSQFSAQYLSTKQDSGAKGEQIKEFLQRQDEKQPEFFHSFDAETQRILHGLHKKNETTKLKALTDLQQLLQTKDSSYFDQFTPTFVNMYKQFASSEHEKRVLEESNRVLAIIGVRGKKSMQTKFKELFPLWFLVMNDMNAEVSASALSAFETTFPKEKWGSALGVCLDGYLNNLKYYLKITPTVVLQENSYLNEGQADYIYERLLTSSLRSIGTACTWIQQEGPQKIQALMSTLQFVGRSTPLLLETLETNKKRAVVISSVLDCIHQLLTNEVTKPYVIENIEIVALKTLHLIDDKERVIQQSLWRGYLTILLQNTPAATLQKIDSLEQRVLNVVKHSAFGIGKQFYQQLIIVLAYLPQASMKDLLQAVPGREELFKTRLSVIRRFLENILYGTQHDEARFFCDHVINCYFECLYFVIVKRIQPVLTSAPEFKSALGQTKNTIRDLIRTPVLAYLKAESVSLYNFLPYKQVPVSLAQFFNMVRPVAPQLWAMVSVPLLELKSAPELNNLVALLDQFCLQTKEPSELSTVITELILSVTTTSLNALMEKVNGSQVRSLSMHQQIFDDLPLVNKLIENVLVVYSRERKEAKFLTKEVWIQLFPIGKFVLATTYVDLLQPLLQSLQVKLLATIDLAGPNPAIFETCHHIRLLQSCLNRMQPGGFDLTEELIIANFESKASPSFRAKWICLFILSDESAYANFKDLLAVPNQEWLVVERCTASPVPQTTPAQRLLIARTLAVENMDYRIFVPSLINLIKGEEATLLAKYATVSSKVRSTSAYFAIYEELFYVLNRLGIDEKAIYRDTFELMWWSIQQQQSVRNNRLLKFINEFGKVDRVGREQVQRAVSTFKSLCQGNHDVASLQKYYSFLWDGFRYHPHFNDLRDAFASFILDFSMYKDVMTNGRMYHLFSAAWSKDEQMLRQHLQRDWNQCIPLICLFLTSHYTFVTLFDHKLKRFLQNFVHNTIQSAIIDRFEQQDESLLPLIECLVTAESRLYGVALRSLIRSFVIEGSETALMVKIAKLYIFQPLLEGKNFFLMRQLVAQLDLKSPVYKAIFEEAFPNIIDHLEKSEGETFFQMLDLTTIYLLQGPSLQALDDDQRLANLIVKLFAQPIDSNYRRLVTFEFVNLIAERKTITPFAEQIKYISDAYTSLFSSNTKSPQSLYSYAIVGGLSFLRKILGFIEAFPPQFIDYVQFSLIDSCITFIELCSTSQTIMLEEQNELMFMEYGETIMRLTQVFPVQDDLSYFTLLRCPFISIQKAAYVALKSINVAKQQLQQEQPPLLSLLNLVDYREEERQKIKEVKALLEEDETQQLDIDSYEVIKLPLSSTELAYYLAWNLLTNPRKVDTQLLLLSRPLQTQYLNNLLYMIEFLQDNGITMSAGSKEVYESDLDLAAIHDDQSEILKLMVIGIYQFISVQQSQFKAWVDAQNDKESLRSIEELIRSHISKSVFEREVDIIESRQMDWQCEEFQIYVTRSLREVTATYQKESQKIEISILVPFEYPLKYAHQCESFRPLKMDVKQGVKIGDAKLKRWSLMIRTLLQNENDSILHALLQWKQNIDKHFEGVIFCGINCQGWRSVPSVITSSTRAASYPKCLARHVSISSIASAFRSGSNRAIRANVRCVRVSFSDCENNNKQKNQIQMYRLAQFQQYLEGMKSQKEEEFGELSKQTALIFQLMRRKIDVYQRKAEVLNQFCSTIFQEEIKAYLERDLNEINQCLEDVQAAISQRSSDSKQYEFLIDMDVKQCICRNRVQLFKWNYDPLTYAQSVLHTIIDTLSDIFVARNTVTVVNTFNPSSLFQLSEEEVMHNLASTLRTTPTYYPNTLSPIGRQSTARLTKENICPNSDDQSMVQVGTNQPDERAHFTSFEACRSQTIESIYNIDNLKIKMPNFSIEDSFNDSPQMQA